MLFLLFIWLFDRRFYCCCCCGCCLVLPAIDCCWIPLFLLMFAAIVSCDLDLPSKARFFLLRHLFFDTNELGEEKIDIKKWKSWNLNFQFRKIFLTSQKWFDQIILLSFLFLQIFTVFWHDTFYLKFFFTEKVMMIIMMMIRVIYLLLLLFSPFLEFDLKHHMGLFSPIINVCSDSFPGSMDKQNQYESNRIESGINYFGINKSSRIEVKNV